MQESLYYLCKLFKAGYKKKLKIFSDFHIPQTTKERTKGGSFI